MIDLNLQRFARGCCGVCETAQENTNAILMTETDDGGVLAAEFSVGAVPADFNRAALGMHGRTYAAMATRTNWTPTGGASSLAWCFTAVSRLGGPAFVGVRRDAEDRNWWEVPIEDAPWFVLATASALRGVLRGEALTPKMVPSDDGRLFNHPGQGQPPPADEEGRI